MTMSSSVPYVLRAINEWILDNNCTPYLIVDAHASNTSVPMDYVKDGQIVLNIGPMAIRDLVIADEHVAFSGRFGGVPHEIFALWKRFWVLSLKRMVRGCGFPVKKQTLNRHPSPIKRQALPR